MEQGALKVAPYLLGMKLSTRLDGRVTSGIIVEVEAYEAKGDEASHTFRGETKRNKIMFGAAGLCYVYFTYGMHYCVNVVTGKQGVGSAVLIRAIEPIQGEKIMLNRRKRVEGTRITNGPAKLTQALGIDKELLGEDLLSSKRIWLEPFRKVTKSEITRSARIGISKAKELEWRFYIKDNAWVSKS